MESNSFTMHPLEATPELKVTDPRFGRQLLDMHRGSVKVLDRRPRALFSVTTAGIATWQASVTLQLFIGHEKRLLQGTLSGRAVDLLVPKACVETVALMAIIADKGLGSVSLVGLVPIEVRHVRKHWLLFN